VEIDVTNTWANRLIGDEQEPADCEWLPGHQGGRFLKEFPDWFLNKTARPSPGRFCFSTWNYFTRDSALQPSGLLGPVRLVGEDWSQAPDITLPRPDDTEFTTGIRILSSPNDPVGKRGQESLVNRLSIFQNTKDGPTNPH
jgi:hypothetical protein